MTQKIPNWIDKDKEYPLMKLVNQGVFPNMNHYTTALNNLIIPDIIKHRIVKRFDAEGKERVFARRYWIKGWSLIEYLEMKKDNERKSEVVEIREEVPKK